ncbi:sce7726 family protein [Aeromonas sp. FDAARGOS 1403]|uniref:sce7726 family protein n=1 Tax=Aeromonas TaxID=642 RepID=UPI001C22672E|nr:sce7726 family protein [Aeromonas sp. FDAARGOS 1403]QXA16568.1 sce7726 family protein [Aeromonas sp. FDAARGOS 1403]
MKEILKEADYKVATIEWIIKKGFLDNDSVLINELPVDNFSRRADLVIANGKLHAIEIKSDADSLSRLSGQIDTYISFFDKVTVVCSQKYTQRALNILPERVELIELKTDRNNNIVLKVKRRGKTISITDPTRYLSFVEKRFLVSSIRQLGLTCSIGESRSSLYNKLNCFPRSTWREISLKYLKDKYRATSDLFLSSVRERASYNNLHLLRPQLNNKCCSLDDSSLELPDNYWEVNDSCEKRVSELGIDISECMYKYGFVPTHPVKVIPRKIKQTI